MALNTYEAHTFIPSPLRNTHFLPNAAFLLPVVKRFAVDFVNGSLCNGQLAGLYGHKEIDVIDFPVGAFHIDTGEIFASAEVGQPVIMDLDQVEHEIFALVPDMKLSIRGLSGRVIDVFLKSGRNISHARFHCLRGSLRRSRCGLWELLRLRLRRRPRMFTCSEKQRVRRQE